MWKRIALGALVVCAAAAGFIATRPAAFVVQRSAVIGAPPEVVYDHIASLRAMNVWSPWVRMDANLKLAYEGPESGVGARSAWQGPEMGSGRLTVTAVKPDREVELRLEMLTPMEATNRVVFALVPAGAGTQVTWRMEGRNGFVAKAVGLFMDMDGMVGGTFAQGLSNLKSVAEAGAQES